MFLLMSFFLLQSLVLCCTGCCLPCMLMMSNVGGLNDESEDQLIDPNKRITQYGDHSDTTPLQGQSEMTDV
jgi:hypothetical protein